MDSITAVLTLKPGREKPVHNRHPWVFSGAIDRVEGDPAPGDLVQVLDANGRFLATGLISPHSQIRMRLLSWDVDVVIDDAFWRGRFNRAIAGRSLLALEPDTNAYRLVNAESDGLPGLIVDKYGDFLVMQPLTAGIDRRKEMLAEMLADLLQPTGIVERADGPVREKEDLPQTTGILWGDAPPEAVVIQENGLKFGVDLLGGHKTGFYLDQRENRALVGQPRFAADRDVLNLFAYTGGFGLYAAAAGARTVTHVDSAYNALEQAERNVALNGWQRPSDDYLAGDVFEILRYYRDEGREFDLIVLDPPKFAHSRRDVDAASRGYKDLNWLAMRLLRVGGLLATFSCSGVISADLFQKIAFAAAIDAQRDVQILRRLGQPADHPIALTFPEAAYLKGLICRVW